MLAPASGAAWGPRPASAPRRSVVGSRSWRALGTSVHVLVTQERSIDAASRAVADVLAEVDAAYSRFRPDSELSMLNRRAGRTTSVGPLLAIALESALRAAYLTRGAVDPTVGAALRRIGYDRDFGAMVDTGGPVVLTIGRIPGWQALEFDRLASTIRVPIGVELDLGSTGKALAADLATARARGAIGRGGVLVSLGGDIATAGPAPSGGWRVLVAEDSETAADSAGEVVAIHDGALATSSTLVRRWTRSGIVMHHIVDPETGLPACGPWRTVSVTAASCVDANAAATAAIVRGADVGWLESLDLPGRLVGRNGEVRRLGGWPEPPEVRGE